jgi:branched-chain amino acid transport system substrate-binding protein
MKGKRLLTLLGATFLVLILVALPFMAGCAKPEPPPPTPPPEVKTLKVGSTLPLGVGMGIETKKCLDVIVRAFNEAGGLTVGGQRYNIDLIVYDDKYTADGGRAAVERLVYEDKVQFMVCQIGSAPILAGLPVTELNKIVSFVGGASLKILDPAYHYVFRTSRIAAIDPAVFGYVVSKHPDMKTLVFLSLDDESGHAQSATWKTMAESFGLNVIDTIFYPRETTDFLPIATKVRTLAPDAVSFPGASDAGTQFGLQLKALYQAGWTGIEFNPAALLMDEVMAVAPEEAVEGLITSVQPTEIDEPDPAARELKELYMREYGSWSLGGVAWVGGWYALIAAIEKANSLDPDDVANAVEGLEFHTPLGYARMVKRPDLGNYRSVEFMPDLYIGEVRDGKLIYTATVPWEEGLAACETIFGGGSWR